MAYTKTKWINGVTPINANNLNNMENGIESLFKEIDEMMTMKKINGTSLTIEDGKKIKEFKVYGKSEQDGTPTSDAPVEINSIGIENLFDKDNANILNAFFETSTPTITSNGNNRTLYIPCKANTTYTFSKAKSNQFWVGYTDELPVAGVTVNEITRGTVATGFYPNERVSVTITTGENAKYLVLRYYHATNDSSYSTEEEMRSTIQIEKGSANKYVPYGKYLRIEHNEETIFVNMAKENLFDKDNYLTIDGFINASTYTIQAATNGQKSAYVKVKPNTQYYISDFNFNSAIVVGSFKDVPKVGDVATNYIIKSATTINLTITTGENDNYIAFMISNASSTTDTSKMRIVEGSSAKDYYELCSNGDIKDEYEVVSGKGVKRIGVVDLSSLTWTQTAISGTEYSFWRCSEIPNIKYATSNQITGNGIAENYVIHKGSGMTSAYDCIAIDTSLVCINAKESPTGLFYYELATPEEFTLEPTAIPMEELGINNYCVNDTLEPNIDCTYYAIFTGYDEGANNLSYDTETSLLQLMKDDEPMGDPVEIKSGSDEQILTASFTTTTITASPTKITLNNSVTIGDKLTISNGGIKISGDVTKIKINYDVTWSSKTSGSKGVMIYKNSQSDSNLITRTIYNTDNPVQPTIVASPRVVNVVQNDILYVYCADSVGASISGVLSQVTVEVIE